MMALLQGCGIQFPVTEKGVRYSLPVSFFERVSQRCEAPGIRVLFRSGTRFFCPEFRNVILFKFCMVVPNA